MLCFSALKFVDEEKKRQFIYDKYYHQGVQINKVYHPQTNWKEIVFSNLNVSACMYLAKTSVIKNFRFREGVWHEDADFTPILLTSAESFCFIPYSAYFRRSNPSSITQKAISQKRLEDLIKMIESLDNFATKNQIDKHHFLCKFLIGQIGYIFELCSANNNIRPDNLNVLQNLKTKYLHRRQKNSIQQLIKKEFKKLLGDF